MYFVLCSDHILQWDPWFVVACRGTVHCDICLLILASSQWHEKGSLKMTQQWAAGSDTTMNTQTDPPVPDWWRSLSLWLPWVHMSVMWAVLCIARRWTVPVTATILPITQSSTTRTTWNDLSTLRSRPTWVSHSLQLTSSFRCRLCCDFHSTFVSWRTRWSWSMTRCSRTAWMSSTTC